MPKAPQPWSLSSLREKVIKIEAKSSISGLLHPSEVEVSVSRHMFADILSQIARATPERAAK